MSDDTDTPESVDLVEAESRELVEPEPTELAERPPEELVERPTTALVERAWYECVACGYRSGHGVHEHVCPRCGATLKHIGVPQE